jgi:hypothetical protein
MALGLSVLKVVTRTRAGTAKWEVARFSEEHSEAGCKQITDIMKKNGWDVGYERVRLIRKELELQARPGRKGLE